ncbi:MAG: ABC transporter permease [Chloroflexi bacterium]|nr:ABC transporter permease [Chloroflexota bacterium]
MKAWINLRLALEALSANKLRSFLTFLGIVIGVGAVIAALSIGRGGRAAIEQQVEGLGSNLLFVRPGATSDSGVRGQQGSAATLTYDDALALADPDLAPSVQMVAPVLNSAGRVVASSNNVFTRIVGVTPEYEFVRNTPVTEGEFIQEQHLLGRSLVVVLGSNVAENLFGEDDPIGQQVTVNNRPFRVIGVLKSKGGSGQGLEDDLMLAPLTTVRYRLFAQRGGTGALTVQEINVQVVDGKHMEQAKLEIADILRERHRITGEDDFTITTQEEVLATRTGVADVLSILLGSTAGISLLVGGIGIMNIMLVSVTERTREIGIRKAVGAKRRNIVTQFLVEAATLSFAGGGLGVVAGWGASKLISNMQILNQTINTVVSPDTVILALAVSAAIGLFFGIYPAFRAARLNPIDALRYE